MAQVGRPLLDGDDIPPVDVSVIIATRDRCERLATSLDALTRLEVPSELRWELIVIDNGSTDATARLLEAYAGRLPLRSVLESRPGISAARNAGLRAARGRVVAMTDDDCIVDRHWLAALWAEFERDATLAGLGGRVELYDPRDQPITIRTTRERVPFDSPYQLFTLIAGCNMAFTRRAMAELGEFDPMLGAGSHACSGEDVDYLYRALARGLKVVYVPDVLVYHNHGRRTDAEVQRLVRNYAIGRGAVYCKHVLASPHSLMRCLYSEIHWHLRQIAHGIRWHRSVRHHIRCLWYLFVGVAYRLTPGRPAGR